MNTSQRDPESAQEPMASIKSDLKGLKRNGAASADELREFLAEMRGKSPQEMLGIVSSSNLVRSAVTATVVLAVVMVTLTVVPYAWGKVFAGDPKPAASQPTPGPTPAATTQPDATDKAAATANDDKTNAKGDDVLKKLGVGEQKSAPPDVNPLEKKADDLLKGLD